MKSRWDCRKITEVFEGRYFLEVILEYTEDTFKKLNGSRRELDGGYMKDVKEIIYCCHPGGGRDLLFNSIFLVQRRS